MSLKHNLEQVPFTSTTNNVTWFCDRYMKPSSNGILRGDDPFEHSLTLLLFQIGFASSLKIIFQYLLKPYREYDFVPQMLGGLALSPTVLGRDNNFYLKMFSPQSQVFLHTYQSIGLAFLIFILTIRFDMDLIKKCGRLEVVIGIASFWIPLFAATFVAYLIRKSITMDIHLYKSLMMVAFLESMTSFHVICSVLANLKLLNSEIGRIATTSSMISGIFSWSFVAVAIIVQDAIQLGQSKVILLSQMSKFVLVIIVVFVFRPLIIRMLERTPVRKLLKESYICVISLMVLFTALYGETTGQHFVLGPLILGLVTPETPVMASSLWDKIGIFVSALFIPCYIINLGRRVDVFLITSMQSFGMIVFVIMVGLAWKFVAIIVPALYYKMALVDALSLALILNFRGFLDIAVYDRMFKKVGSDCFVIIVIMAVARSAIFIPLFKSIYNPSRRYVTYQRRTIQHQKRDTEFRILVCIHEQEYVPSAIKILEASNPTEKSPFIVYVINLEKLVGRTIPLLISHKFDRDTSNSLQNDTSSSHIINAFRQYEWRNQSVVSLQCFTSVSPYATMHDDVCSLALEKVTSFAIIPFRKSDSTFVRSVNRNVTDNVPCSIGMLLVRDIKFDDDGENNRLTNVCVVFLGGADDREALVYSARMANNPNVRLVFCRVNSSADAHGFGSMVEQKLDLNAIADFCMVTDGNKNIEYGEEMVTDAYGLEHVLEGMDNNFDIIIVGRRHDYESKLLVGLSDWREIEELGVVGDILASSNNNNHTSLLAVQQHTTVVHPCLNEKPFNLPR